MTNRIFKKLHDKGGVPIINGNLKWILQERKK